MLFGSVISHHVLKQEFGIRFASGWCFWQLRDMMVPLMITVSTCFRLAFLYDTGPSVSAVLDEPIETALSIFTQSLVQGMWRNSYGH